MKKLKITLKKKERVNYLSAVYDATYDQSVKAN